jgi:hypothetical protein
MDTNNFKNMKKDDLIKIINNDLLKQIEELAELNWGMSNEIDRLNDKNNDYELYEENDRLKKENEKLKEQNHGLIASLKFINKMYNLNLDNILNQN